MIELNYNVLSFRFPEVHPRAVCRIDFQRTLRIPDDNRDYPLPPGLDRFPVSHVDDYVERLPDSWRGRGGVFLPMYQAEALWIHFSGRYPCAIKIAAGKINAVTGAAWTSDLSTAPQDYVVTPKQPWLDGFNVSKSYIRQFVAMPLGEGYTAEEQLTGEAEHGGLQIIVYPMKREVYAEHFERPVVREDVRFLRRPVVIRRKSGEPDMGLAPGGLMRQELYKDEYGTDAWDQEQGARCFVHIANSEQYQTITGSRPPHRPPTAGDYARAGLPWFDYYSDGKALPGAGQLGKLTSVAAKVIAKNNQPLSDNDSVEPVVVKQPGGARRVRDGKF
jgi:hypothetical protein